MTAAHTATALAVDAELDVAHGFRVGALRQRVLAVFHQHDRLAHEALQGIDERRDHPVAGARKLLDGRAFTHRELQAIHCIDAVQLVVAKRPARVFGQISLLEQGVDRLRADLAFRVFRVGLHGGGEIDLQPARQFEAVVRLHDISHAALARLAVDADNFLVGAPDVRGIDGQIRDLPDLAPLLAARQAFLDGVLMAAGEGREHEFPRIRVTRMHR